MARSSGGFFDFIVGLIAIGVLYGLWQFVRALWDEWSGAYGRWLRGEPLRASALWSLRHREEMARLAQEREEVRSSYARNHNLMRDQNFRRRFKLLELHEEVRAGVYNRYKNTCAACGKQPKRKGGLHIDHIRPVSRYPELEYVDYNLQLLCAACNRHKHDYDGDDWKEVTLARARATRRKKAKARKQRDSSLDDE